MAGHYPEATWLSQVLPPGNVTIGNSRPAASLFHKAWWHLSDDQAAAFTITFKPHYCNISIDTAANLFNIPDLCVALGDKFLLEQMYADCCGQCQSAPNVHLPFSHLHVWHNFQMQQHSTQDKRVMLLPHTVQALPSSTTMPFRQYNTILVDNTDGSANRTSGLSTGEFFSTYPSHCFHMAHIAPQGAELSRFG